MLQVKPDKNGIKQAISVLKRSGVVVYPTDTAYALGGIFDSKKVQERILRIKGRKDDKFTLIASSFFQVQNFFKLNALAKKIAKKYWPGPLSLVVSDRFAVRIPKNKIAQALARAAGRPLIATSANLSGQKTLYDSKNIIRQFQNQKNRPDLIIDFGRLRKIDVSTIVSAGNGGIEIIRQGSVKINQV